MTKIHQWSDLESDFDDGIILGNGASLAVSATFSYSSLFNWASKKKLFTPNAQKVFKHLKTKDFELVLRILWHASHVNQALRVKEKMTVNAYKEVREALVRAIRDTHVKYEVTRPFLSLIGEFLRRFSTVGIKWKGLDRRDAILFPARRWRGLGHVSERRYPM